MVYIPNSLSTPKKTFQLEYEFNAKYEGTTEKIIDHAMNANGIRDTARILKISPTTVIDRLKQQANKLVQFNLFGLIPRHLWRSVNIKFSPRRGST